MPDKERRLPDGSTVEEDIFDNLESSLSGEDPDEFVENRLPRRKKEDSATPFTAQASGTLKTVAGARHEERSERAQATDEAFNAPIAPDYETWRENPGQYDLPGVDTIPRGELARRGERFLERGQDVGAVENVERKTLPAARRGQFSADPKTSGNPLTGEFGYSTSVKVDPEVDEADFAAFGEASVLAHETGHAVDFQAGGDGSDFMSDRGFFARNEGDLLGQAVKLSERVRGTITESRARYREDNKELIADSIAAVALEPRAAKREAPDLVNALKDDIDLRVGDEGKSVFDF